MKKKCIPILLTILLVLCAFPAAAFAADIPITASGTYDLSTMGLVAYDRLVIGASGETLDVTLTGSSSTTYTSLWIICDDSVNLTLQDVNINYNALLFNTGANTLTVSGTCNLTGMGIGTAADVSLSIYGDGTLNVTGVAGEPGIYGSNITIHSGTINATGGEGAEGIFGRNITILNGTITATGGEGFEGIYCLSNIMINGGNVTANGGGGAAGIGGSSITINSGTINATGGDGGAGIGNSINSTEIGEVQITGGNVTATGGRESTDGLGAAGIGSGVNAESVSVEISGGTVNAYGNNCAAGIGGGQDGRVGTITISGGTVNARGGEDGAGIGGGRGSFGTPASIVLSGGTVYADGLEYADDIGNGADSSIVTTLSISGSAAVFAANDKFLSPVTTTTHTHTTYTADTETSYGIAIPSAWVPTFGSYLRPCKLSYNAGSGSGTVSAEVTQHYQTTTLTADGSGLSHPYYKFSGWNTKADGTGTAYAPGSSFTFSADTTLYAQWIAQPELTSSVADGKIYTKGRITLTPNIPGGTWSFDSSMLSRDGNTFKGLKRGTTTVTYTVDGVSVSYTVVIKASGLPATGQDGTLIWVFAAAAAAALAAAVALKHKRKAT